MSPAPVRWLPRAAARRAALAALGTIAACWLAGAAVAQLGSTPGVPLDVAARSVLEPTRAVAPVDALSELLAVVGEQPVSIVVAAALAIVVITRWGLQPGLAFALASALSAGQVILMKSVVQRPGPGTAFFEGLGSFPSGHAANAAVIATFGGLLVRRRWMWAAGAAYVVLVAASRVVLRAHWLTDTVVGAAEGAAVALLVWAVWSGVRSVRRERAADA